MNLKALNYFISVFDGSFSAASKQNYVAQPSISTAIGNLESELSVQLFQGTVKAYYQRKKANASPLAKQLNESKQLSRYSLNQLSANRLN